MQPNLADQPEFSIALLDSVAHATLSEPPPSGKVEGLSTRASRIRKNSHSHLSLCRRYIRQPFNEEPWHVFAFKSHPCLFNSHRLFSGKSCAVCCSYIHTRTWVRKTPARCVFLTHKGRGFSNPNNYSFGKSLILVRRTLITDFVYSLFLRS